MRTVDRNAARAGDSSGELWFTPVASAFAPPIAPDDSTKSAWHGSPSRGLSPTQQGLGPSENQVREEAGSLAKRRSGGWGSSRRTPLQNLSIAVREGLRKSLKSNRISALRMAAL